MGSSIEQPLDYATGNGRSTGRRNWLLASVGLLTALLPSAWLYLSLNMLFVAPLTVGLICVIAGCFRTRDVARKRALVAGVTLCVIAAVGPIALSAWENREGAPVRVVLPAGYRGEFSIVKDHLKGADLVLRDGQWVFDIPASGVLEVKETYPFMMWHTETYVYSDGSAARVQDLGVEAGNIVTGPGTSEGSTDYDGTTFRWKVLDSQ